MAVHTTYSCDRCKKKDLDLESVYTVTVVAEDKYPVYAGEVSERYDQQWILCRNCKDVHTWFLFEDDISLGEVIKAKTIKRAKKK